MTEPATIGAIPAWLPAEIAAKQRQREIVAMVEAIQAEHAPTATVVQTPTPAPIDAEHQLTRRQLIDAAQASARRKARERTHGRA